MELKEKVKYIATPSRIVIAVGTILVTLAFLQVITVEILQRITTDQSPVPPDSEKEPAKQTKKPAEDVERLRRIQNSIKEVLLDGTIHLVHQPERPLSQRAHSGQQEVYDTNDNLLWRGIAKDSPYKYLSWAENFRYSRFGGFGRFTARDMKKSQMITLELSRTLEIPVRSQEETIEIWRYAAYGEFFTGYKVGGEKIGYAGATGFEDSKSAVRPLGEFGSFFAWRPEDSLSPTVLWQTKRRIYEINFEKRKAELLFESPDADIDGIFVHTWDSFRPNDAKPAPGYRSMLYCLTRDGKYHIVMRDTRQSLTIKTPEEWNGRMDSSTIRLTAFEQSIFLSRMWIASPPWPNYFGYFGNALYSEKLWREYRAAPKERRLDIFKVDNRGNIELTSQFGWTVLGKDLTAQTSRQLSIGEKAQRFVYQFSPPLYDLFTYVYARYMWSPYGAFRNDGLAIIFFAFEQTRPGLRVWNWILSALMVALAYLHARSRCTSRGALVFWLVFVGAFNVGGLLTYLALNHTPLIKCASCGKSRGLNQPKCVRCHADLPAPKPGRLDLIFDAQLKATT